MDLIEEQETFLVIENCVTLADTDTSQFRDQIDQNENVKNEDIENDIPMDLSTKKSLIDTTRPLNDNYSSVPPTVTCNSSSNSITCTTPSTSCTVI